MISEKTVKRIFLMNVLGACGITLAGIALFLNKLDNQVADLLVTIALFYALLIALPAFSAYSLKSQNRHLHNLMIYANGFFILIWIVSVIAGIFFGSPLLGSFILGALMFVIPQLINIYALKKMRQQ